MNVETEPKMGDGENWTNGKVRKTELTENWYLQFYEKIEKWLSFR